MSEERERNEERYLTALHAMQSGVAMEMGQGSSDTSPKHLRVGVNSAMVQHEALVRILIEKGLFTSDDYIAAIADTMEAEVARYEERISESVGTEVKLA